MGKLYQGFSRRVSFGKELYLWGWRWVVLVIWGFPYGLIGGYDLLQGQGYLPSDSPLISQIVPNWLPQVWFIVGVIAIIWATFEDAYRITRKRQNDVGTISHLISLVREADKFSITSVRNNSADVDIDTAIQEAVKWTIKAISEVEARLLDPVRHQQLLMEAELPLKGDINHTDFDAPFPHTTVDSRLALIRERHYRVRNWIRNYIEDA